MSDSDAVPRMIEILKRFANSSDPVYDTRIRESTPGIRDIMAPEPKMIAVKMCSLCGAHGGHNQENLTHNSRCVWMEARQLVETLKELGAKP